MSTPHCARAAHRARAEHSRSRVRVRWTRPNHRRRRPCVHAMGTPRTQGDESPVSSSRSRKLALFKISGEQWVAHSQKLSFRRGRAARDWAPDGSRLPARQRRTPRRPRAAHNAAHPVHVTLRAVSRSLRSRFVAKTAPAPRVLGVVGPLVIGTVQTSMRRMG